MRAVAAAALAISRLTAFPIDPRREPSTVSVRTPEGTCQHRSLLRSWGTREMQALVLDRTHPACPGTAHCYGEGRSRTHALRQAAARRGRGVPDQPFAAGSVSARIQSR